MHVTHACINSAMYPKMFTLELIVAGKAIFWVEEIDIYTVKTTKVLPKINGSKGNVHFKNSTACLGYL